MSKQPKAQQYTQSILNRKARHEFEILETVVAGIQLAGSEVKSVRLGQASLNESFAMIIRDEVWVENMQISPYRHNNIEPLEPKRSRKLLLKRKEIEKLKVKVTEKGLALIPLKAFFSQKGFLKIELAIARGKKLYDKRETIKNRDIQRQLNQLKKQF